MNSKESWAYLSRVVEGPSRNITALLNAGRDADEIAHGIKTAASWIGALADETRTRRDWDRAAEDLGIAAEHGARLITPEDDEWPQEALNQAFSYAALNPNDHSRNYQADAVAPHALWMRGGNLRTLVAQAVAVVGTRAVSRYGHDSAAMIARGLAHNHWTVISGAALGIDTVAHETAMAEGGATVAILACGIDVAYPKRNERLLDRIPHSGAVITEYPPGTTPQRHRFLTRNRLVAGLSLGTVVVEAAWRSGALNTLSWAEALGRVPMAVPGPITTAGSLGCHERIKTRRAELITGSDDVRSLLSAVGEVDVNQQYELEFEKSELQALGRNELRVFDSVPPVGESGMAAQEIAAGSGMPVPLVVSLLVELEKKTLVTREGVLWSRARDV